MDDNDRLGVGVDPSLHLGNVHVERMPLAVDEDRRRIAILHRVSRRDVGDGGNDYLITWTDAQGDERQVYGRGAVVDRHRMLHPAVLGELALESGQELACRRYPGGVQALIDIFLLVSGQHRDSNGDPMVHFSSLLSSYWAGGNANPS